MPWRLAIGWLPVGGQLSGLLIARCRDEIDSGLFVCYPEYGRDVDASQIGKCSGTQSTILLPRAAPLQGRCRGPPDEIVGSGPLDQSVSQSHGLGAAHRMAAIATGPWLIERPIDPTLTNEECHAAFEGDPHHQEGTGR